MSPQFETPPEKEADHPALKLLQEYSDTVRMEDYLSEMGRRKKSHAVQAMPGHDKAAFAGDAQCAACHQAEMAVWQQSKHAGAYNALAVVATHPKGRNFDGECIVCHTVGYEYKTGYLNNKVTPNLQNVQCEACHGPASLHVAEEVANAKNPRRATHGFAASLSPWKVQGQGHLPALNKFQVMVAEKDVVKKEALLSPAEKQAYDGVYKVCLQCHDIDNDPHFDLAAYWPKVAHTGLKKK